MGLAGPSLASPVRSPSPFGAGTPAPSGQGAHSVPLITGGRISTHTSLDAMLRMVRLRLLGVQGDGNCAYYAALGGLDAPTLAALGLPRLDHLGTQLPPTVRDLQVVGVLREHCTDWLQLDAHAEHRRVGTFGGDIYESAPGSYVMPPPPSEATNCAGNR